MPPDAGCLNKKKENERKNARMFGRLRTMYYLCVHKNNKT